MVGYVVAKEKGLLLHQFLQELSFAARSVPKDNYYDAFYCINTLTQVPMGQTDAFVHFGPTYLLRILWQSRRNPARLGQDLTLTMGCRPQLDEARPP